VCAGVGGGGAPPASQAHKNVWLNSISFDISFAHKRQKNMLQCISAESEVVGIEAGNICFGLQSIFHLKENTVNKMFNLYSLNVSICIGASLFFSWLNVSFFCTNTITLELACGLLTPYYQQM
jgi:hypothetical protein